MRVSFSIGEFNFEVQQKQTWRAVSGSGSDRQAEAASTVPGAVATALTLRDSQRQCAECTPPRNHRLFGDQLKHLL